MEILDLEPTGDTPRIILNKEQGIFEISGRSLSQNSPGFYRPILKWLADYSKDPNPTTPFSFKLEYINTSSAKLVLDILSALSAINGASVDWYFRDDDEDMEEAGEEFSELVKIPFSFKAY